MAAIVARLISAFMRNSPTLRQDISTSDASNSVACATNEKSTLLCKQLNLIASIDSPVETRLKELEALTASGIAQRTF